MCIRDRYEAISPKTGEIIGSKNSKILVHENCTPVVEVIGSPIYEVTHVKTKQKIFVNPGEIKR